MKKLVLLLSVILFTTTLSFSQETSTYKQTLKKMMVATGSEAAYKAVIDQMMVSLKAQKPGVPEGFWNELGTMLTKAASEDIVDMLAPIYQKNLTEDDLKATIAFYETPAGQKLALKTPLIARESIQVGQEWGMKIGQQLVEKLKEKGY